MSTVVSPFEGTVTLFGSTVMSPFEGVVFTACLSAVWNVLASVDPDLTAARNVVITLPELCTHTIYQMSIQIYLRQLLHNEKKNGVNITL